MPEAEMRLSEKWTVGREAKLRGPLWNFEDNLSAKNIILRYTSKPGRGYLFYNPPINFYNEHSLLWQRENIQWAHSTFSAKQIQAA